MLSWIPLIATPFPDLTVLSFYSQLWQHHLSITKLSNAMVYPCWTHRPQQRHVRAWRSNQLNLRYHYMKPQRFSQKQHVVFKFRQCYLAFNLFVPDLFLQKIGYHRKATSTSVIFPGITLTSRYSKMD